MPCGDGPPLGPWEGGYERVEYHNMLERMLCEVLNVLERKGAATETYLKKGTLEWWEAHKEEDRKRLERELRQEKRAKDREALLAKLTPYERELLGK